MGVNSDSAPGIENYMFNFNNPYFTVEPIVGGLEFDHNNAIISDLDGNLLFYSNGCAVANRNHEIMPNGEDINAGQWFEVWWGGDCRNGYPGTQNILALPDPANDQGYYLITKPITDNPDGPSFRRDFQYSYVDMSMDNGLGDVTIKNKIIYDADTIQSSYLHATKHFNGKDWWIIQPSDESNRYLKFLLNENGLNFYDVQSIGKDFHWNAGAGGRAKFSPNGLMFAYYNRHNQLRLFNFDRSNGQLSNLREMYIDSIPIFNGIEFSSSGRFLYFSLSTKMYQLDMENINDPDALVLIDEWNGIQDPFSTTFRLMERGPDCRIYICSGSSTNSYHVINKPDEKGLACDFVQQGIALPHVSGRASFPNFPNFRIDEEEVCDPTLSSIFDLPVEIVSGLKLRPNPVKDVMNLSIPIGREMKYVEVYTLNGTKVLSRIGSFEALELNDFEAGMYVVKVGIEDGKAMVEKFVKL